MTIDPATPRPTRQFTWTACLLAGLLAACGAEPPPAPQEAPEPQPAVTPAPRPPAIADKPPGALPPVRELEVIVEGQRELREATLFESPQGYAIYVLPQLTMTPEEPCCDIAWARADDGFFMRIERIDPDQDLAVLRENMALALSAIGEAEAMPADQIGAEPLRAAELAMQARGDGISGYMLVARIDGGRYRITLHMPHREALEGIAPSMWAMLSSLRTTGPRPPV